MRVFKNMRFVLFLVLLAFTLTSCSSIMIGKASKVNFKELLYLAELYKVVRFEGDEATKTKYSQYYPEMYFGHIPETNNRYFIGTDHAKKEHFILICGTANLKNAILDMKIKKEKNLRLGIKVHKGFNEAATALYKDIRKQLNKNYTITIMGHSLGGAEAVILHMYLKKDYFKVKKTIAFGQPKVTNFWGALKYSSLPVIRIVGIYDVVPLLPPHGIINIADRYRHLGPEILLLDDKYYCYLEESEARGSERNKKAFWFNLENELNTLVNEHMIDWYIDNLKIKTSEAVEVPYWKKDNYYQPK